MEAYTKNSSVRFKQRILTEFLAVEGVSTDETGVRTAMTVENELGYTAKWTTQWYQLEKQQV